MVHVKDFEPLFVNWVSNLLDIKLSSNLSNELRDGNVRNVSRL